MLKDEFSTFHPLVNLFYFAIVLICAMLFMHPLYLLLALLCLCSYNYQLDKKGFWRKLRYLLPLIFFTAGLSMLFNHQGVTILGHFPSGNPLTLESIIYAFAAGLVLANLLIGFSSLIKVLTEEKIIYLCGRFSPALALVITMSLRFITKFQTELKQISQSRRIFGDDLKKGSLTKRLHAALNIFSVMISWALESSLDVADSMRSRGYGIGKRGSFALYRFERRDYWLLLWLFLLGLYLTVGIYFKAFSWHYFPKISAFSLNAYQASVFLAYLLIALTPIFCRLIYHYKPKSQNTMQKEP